jgi:hypothetical protein
MIAATYPVGSGGNQGLLLRISEHLRNNSGPLAIVVPTQVEIATRAWASRATMTCSPRPTQPACGSNDHILPSFLYTIQVHYGSCKSTHTRTTPRQQPRRPPLMLTSATTSRGPAITVAASITHFVIRVAVHVACRYRSTRFHDTCSFLHNNW